MTPTELDAALDAMQSAAAGDPGKAPGLITVESGDWITSLAAIGATCARLDDGLRYRDIRIHIGSGHTTALLTQAEAADRGEPYRDLAPSAGP